MPPLSLQLRVPATSGNLGPGFDCLGMALELFTMVSFAPAEHASITIRGEGATFMPQDASNLIWRSIEALYWRLGKGPPPLAIAIESGIPISRGLGSSAAAIVAGLVAANYLLGQPLREEELIALGAQIEGHPDNVVPALLGGITIVVEENGRYHCLKLPVPQGLRAVLFVPDQPMSTHEARAVLPAQVSLTDAVHNVGRAALLVGALSQGRGDLLRVATQDRLHQPWRQQLFPQIPHLFAAALEAGAMGVFLSGAGSTILALAQGQEGAIAKAMERRAQEQGLTGRSLITAPSPVGVQVTSPSPTLRTSQS